MADSARGLFADQESLSPDIEARLTEVVVGLRTGIPFDELISIYEDANGELDKLVAASVLDCFLGEAQALYGLSQFFLKSYQLRLVRKQRILSLEDLLVELRNGRGQGVEVPDFGGSLGDVLGGAQRANGRRN